MDRRRLLEKALGAIPMTAAAAALAPMAAEASNASRPRVVRNRAIQGLYEDMQPGRLNGLTVVLRIIRPDTQRHADFVINRNTVIVITGARVTLRQLIEDLNIDPEAVNLRLLTAPVSVWTGANSRNPRRVEIDAP